jgi:formylglycine-generating enzyme required for sulfatase activity
MKSLRPIALLSVLLLSQCETPSGTVGIRVAPEKQAKLTSATKAAPFVNSLGMKFVPVPGTKILMCTTETTVGQYQAAGMGHEAPGFPQGSTHPAVNVSWNDAKACCAWLSKREGLNYRLPKEAEWSAAVGGSEYPWGSSWPPPNECGNYLGQEAKVPEMVSFLRGRGWDSATVIGGFRDRHVFTAPVGSYQDNWLGIYDLGGNVWEWTTNGVSGVLRGASWFDNNRVYLRSSFRIFGPPMGRYGADYGFRVVLVVAGG